MSTQNVAKGNRIFILEGGRNIIGERLGRQQEVIHNHSSGSRKLVWGDNRHTGPLPMQQLSQKQKLLESWWKQKPRGLLRR
jgi:hypothetical protein